MHAFLYFLHTDDEKWVLVYTKSKEKCAPVCGSQHYSEDSEMSGRNGFCVLSRNLSPNAPLSAAHFRMRKIINDVRVACSAGGPLSYRSAI